MKPELEKLIDERTQEIKQIEVKVNERPVVLAKHKVTGLEIKQIAIEQSVAIQTDFVLFEVKGDRSLKQIGDSEVVQPHKGQQFRATAPDDNSYI